MAAVQEQTYGGQVPRTASSATLPPSYDALLASAATNKPQASCSEPPPPTYDEAMHLIGDEKLDTDNKNDERAKQETSDQMSINTVDSSKP